MLTERHEINYSQYIKILLTGLATITIWNGVLNLLDKYVNNSVRNIYLSTVLGFIILFVLNDDVAPFA